MFLGSQVMKNIIKDILPETQFIEQQRFSKLYYNGHKKFQDWTEKVL